VHRQNCSGTGRDRARMAPSSSSILHHPAPCSPASEPASRRRRDGNLPGYDPRPSSQSTVHPRTRRLEDAKRLGFSACALPRLGRPWHPSLVRVIPALAVRKSLAVPHLGTGCSGRRLLQQPHSPPIPEICYRVYCNLVRTCSTHK
jgi:hypothetical protein